MQISNYTENKEKAINLARQLSGDTSVNAEIDFTIFDQATNVPESENEVTHLAQHLGIYLASHPDGKSYRRDRELCSEFPLWADVDEIPNKSSSKKRILLVGESVARGFFFDPVYTFAKLLDAQINFKTDPSFEVVDLAAARIRIEELQTLIEQAVNLEPDALVIFAGNNWLNESFSSQYLEEISSSVEHGDHRHLSEIVTNRLELMVDDFFRSISAIKEIQKIPCVFVIPEFNLKDWQWISNHDRVIICPSHSVAEVEELIKAGEVFMQQNEFEQLNKIALELVTLCPTHPFAYQWLAAIYMEKGDFFSAKTYLTKAKDTRMFKAYFVPTILSVVKKAIVRNIQEHKFIGVDLESLFEAVSKNGIPGKELFLDYCHLSYDGLVLSSKKVAECLLLAFGKKFEETELLPDPNILARAHFCAALHNAHFGPQINVLAYHCEEAVKFDRDALKWMRLFIDLSTSKIPWDLNPVYLELLKCNLSHNHDGGLLQGIKILDWDLVNAMMDVLKKYKAEGSLTRAKRFQQFTTRKNAKVNLLESYYSQDSYLQFFSTKYYFECFLITNNFKYFVEVPEDIFITITYRVPWKINEQPVLLKLNDFIFARLEATSDWRTVKLQIGESHINSDLNILQVIWPVPQCEFLKMSGESSAEFVRRIYQPCYGEILELFVDLKKDIETDMDFQYAV